METERGFGVAKRYALSDDKESKPPNYQRAVAALSDADLEAEILGGLGDPGFRAALVAEAEARAARGAPS